MNHIGDCNEFSPFIPERGLMSIIDTDTKKVVATLTLQELCQQ